VYGELPPVRLTIRTLREATATEAGDAENPVILGGLDTVKVPAAEVWLPDESRTVSERGKFPVAEGVHENVEAFTGRQPCGKPE
jgi:hypothetical protein